MHAHTHTHTHIHTHTHYSNIQCVVTHSDMEIKDGERLPLAVKDMGSCEVFPHALVHSPNGRSAYVKFTTYSNIFIHKCIIIH